MLRSIFKVGRLSTRTFSCPSIVACAKSSNKSVEELVEEKWIKRIKGHDVIHESHSSLLCDQDKVYEIQSHRALPGQMDNYLHEYEDYIDMVKKRIPSAHVVGSFQTVVGDQDEAVHIWRYDDAYKGADKLIRAFRVDKNFHKQVQVLGSLLKKRENSFVRTFVYWGSPEPKSPSHIYEMRRYLLKPGQMIEWGNQWAHGLAVSQDHDQDFAGFFSQVGQLFMVYHIWAYEDLDDRRKIRENLWKKPEWDNTVTNSVKLMNQLKSTIMIPTDFSPTQ